MGVFIDKTKIKLINLKTDNIIYQFFLKYMLFYSKIYT